MRLTEKLSRGGCVGRYGGEEFVMIVPHLSREEGENLADSVVKLVAATEFPGLNLAGPVTCSLGASWVDSSQFTLMEEMFAAADKLMYVAKKGGKNQFRFEALGASSTQPVPAATQQSVPPATGGGEQKKDAFNPTQQAKPVTNKGQRDAEQAAVTHAVLDHMRRLADQLNRDTPRHFVTMRKQPRKELLTKCLLCGFVGKEMKIFQESAYLRNISTGGIGLLANRPLTRGDPVEITIPQGNGQLYVTGLVCFCRHIEGRIHDVGVQFTTHSRQPIFSHDPIGAVNHQGWLADALAEVRKRVRA